MSEAIIVALIGFLGTAITVLVPLLVSQNKIDKKLSAHIEDNEKEMATEHRARILTFDDNLCRGMQFTEESWNDILSCVDDYEEYCSSHPKYKNNKGKLAMEHIKVVYGKTKQSNSFLTHIETIK